MHTDKYQIKINDVKILQHINRIKKHNLLVIVRILSFELEFFISFQQKMEWGGHGYYDGKV